MDQTIISFSSSDSILYRDESVVLSDASHTDLISTLHKALMPYRPASNGPIRNPAERMLDINSSYEQDYRKAHKRLSQISWKQFDLQTAAFLMAYRGCLGTGELLAITPFILEIMLCAEIKQPDARMPEPFQYILPLFLKPRAGEIFELEKLYNDPNIRALIAKVFAALKEKYPLDKEPTRIFKQWSAGI